MIDNHEAEIGRNSIVLARKFQMELKKLVLDNLGHGTPIPNMILSLTDEEFQLRMALQTIRADNLAAVISKGIVPVRGNVKLPPPPGQKTA